MIRDAGLCSRETTQKNPKYFGCGSDKRFSWYRQFHQSICSHTGSLKNDTAITIADAVALKLTLKRFGKQVIPGVPHSRDVISTYNGDEATNECLPWICALPSFK